MVEIFRMFSTVMEHRSFSKAGEKLNVSQPAVSQQIKNLEEIYHSRLFVRKRNGVIPTGAGEALLPYAKEIVRSYDESIRALQDITSQNAPVHIGASLTIGEYLLPKVVAHCKRNHPNMLFQLKIANTEDVIDLLRKDEIDVALVEGEIHDPGLTVDSFMTDELVIATSPMHAWGDIQELEIKQLQEETFILREPGSGTRKLAQETLEEMGIQLDTTNLIELRSTQALKEFAECGLGAAVLSLTAIQKEIQLGTLCAKRIIGKKIHRNFFWVMKPNRFLHQNLKELKQIIFKTNWSDSTI